MIALIDGDEEMNKKWVLVVLAVIVLGTALFFARKSEKEEQVQEIQKEEKTDLSETIWEKEEEEEPEVTFINMDGLFFLTKADQEGFQETVLDWLSGKQIPTKKVKVYEQMEEDEVKFTFYLIVTRADEKHFVRGIYDLEDKSVDFALVEETELPGREKKELTEEEKAELEKEAKYLKETFVEEPKEGE